MKKIISLLLILFFCSNFATFAEYLVKTELAKDIYKAKDSSTHKWKIINSEDKIILDGNFDKVGVIIANKNKPKEYNNLIFWGLYKTDTPVIHFFVPNYDTKNFFKNIFEVNNELSHIKFKNYPTDSLALIYKKDKRFGYLTIKDNKFILFKPTFNGGFNSKLLGDEDITYIPLSIVGFKDYNDVEFYNRFSGTCYSVDEFGEKHKTNSSSKICRGYDRERSYQGTYSTKYGYEIKNNDVIIDFKKPNEQNKMNYAMSRDDYINGKKYKITYTIYECNMNHECKYYANNENIIKEDKITEITQKNPELKKLLNENKPNNIIANIDDFMTPAVRIMSFAIGAIFPPLTIALLLEGNNPIVNYMYGQGEFSR